MPYTYDLVTHRPLPAPHSAYYPPSNAPLVKLKSCLRIRACVSRICARGIKNRASLAKSYIYELNPKTKKMTDYWIINNRSVWGRSGSYYSFL